MAFLLIGFALGLLFGYNYGFRKGAEGVVCEILRDYEELQRKEKER